MREGVSPRRDLLGDDPRQQRPLQVVLHEGPVHGGPHVAHGREAGRQVVRDDVRVKVRAAEVLPGAAGHALGAGRSTKGRHRAHATQAPIGCHSQPNSKALGL